MRRSFARLLRVDGRRATAVVLALLLLAVGLLAVRHPGQPTPRVDVNDGGIWVTNRNRQMVGHLNYSARVLDAGMVTQSKAFELGQAGEDVTVTDDSANAVAPVDVANVRLRSAAPLTATTVSVQGGHRVGLLDTETGNLWAGDVADLATMPLTDGSALAGDLEGGVLTVTQSGTVIAASAPQRRLTTVTVQGSVPELDTTALDVDRDATLTATAVGEQPVLLEQESQTLILPGGRTVRLADHKVPSGAVLQAPGPEADTVLLATDTTLVSVRLEDGEVTSTPASREVAGPGHPAAPVRLGECDYAAWAGTGAYLRRCGGAEEHRLSVDTLARSKEAVFRTNRNLIVLNDEESGSVWLPDENMVLAAGWDEIENQVRQRERPEDAPQTTEEVADPRRQETNTPPIIQNDDLGVRPGRATTLDVLGNDSDPDGDVLTARPVSQPAFGALAVSRGGQALRFDATAEATGSTSFTYEGSDGEASNTATVNVRVVPWEENSAPVRRRDPKPKLGSRARIETNILPHFTDPDGDPIYLEQVTAPEGLQVQFREEGTITVTDLGRAPGPVEVGIQVTDGRESLRSSVTVVVAEGGNSPPTANGDFYVGRVGEPVLLQPLANDTDPDGDSLTLLGSTAPPNGATLDADGALGSLTFSGRVPGSHTIAYTITDGPTQVPGVIRVDVVADDATAAPVAEDDLVLLPPGGAALSEPIGNDSDPSGGVLVVQSVQVPAGSPLEATLIDHHLVRVTAPAGLTEPATLTYTLSNGHQTAEGRILVVGMQNAPEDVPPQLQPDRGKVRVGDVGAVDVLANDRSPAGLRMRVEPHLEYTPNPAVGRPFVTGNQVRLEAGGQAGTMHVNYSVRDSEGRLASATVTFEVLAAESANTRPRPRPLTAWAVSGQTVRIPVPTAGIDPDGDSVVLAGIDSPPQKGTARLGIDWIEYTPGPDQAGTDLFTYTVVDRMGQEAPARVRVGIAPRATFNEHPTAVPDVVLVRPGRTLHVPVLENDLDPNGDALSVERGSVTSKDPRVTAQARDDAVVVTTPEAAGSYPASYGVSDGNGGTDTGTVTLNVQPDAPLSPPAVRDDVVPAEDVPDDGRPVTVDVLANDADPDGDRDRLTVSSGAEGVRVTADGLEITPHEQRRLVVYTVTDQDGLTGDAVVSVPGLARDRPEVDGAKVPLTVRGGQPVDLDLTSLVKVRPGRTPRIADSASVRGSVGIDEVTVRNDTTLTARAKEIYAGPAGVTVRVADGEPQDRGTLSATLTIPITVKPAVNRPPTLTPTPLRVGAGEDPVVSDLALMVTDPDEADASKFRYALTETPAGVQATLDGSRLSVGVAAEHPRGDAGAIGVSVDDGSGEVTTRIPVTVIASSKPKIQVSEAVLNATKVGVTENVDLTRYTINPFPKPFTIVDSKVLEGEASVTREGTVLRVTPRRIGTVTVIYRLMDATGDADRVVEGRVRLVVRDRPAPPTQVAVTPTGSGRATVSYQPGADNGARIEGFTITSVTTGRSYPCAVASCEVTGLENGAQHSFTVVARNAVGASEPSAPSPPVLVDVKPEKPGRPTGTVGDGTITVRWRPPANDGSPLQRYRVYVTGPAAREPIVVDARTTQVTVPGLSNGANYAVAVVAENRSGQASDPSESLTGLIPFGRPGAPTKVQATTLPPERGSARLEVSWTAGPDNGRPFDTARIAWAGGSRDVPLSGGTSSAVVSVPASESLGYSVALHTAGGWSDATSGTAQSVTAPPAPDPPQVSATGANGELRVSGLAVKPGNGYRADQLTLERSLDGRTWQPHTGTLTGLTNGRAYTLHFRQVARDFGPSAGSTVTVGPVTPYGPPIPPTLTASSERGAVAFRYHYEPTNGGPRVESFSINVDGKQTRYEATDGTHRVEASPGSRVSAQAVACYADGTCRSSPTVTGSPWGTVSVAVTPCRADPVQPPAAPRGPCSTFTVTADRWVDTPTLNCTFVSDVDGASRAFQVPTGSGARASGMRTNADQDTLQGWLGSKLTCRPADR